MKSRVLWMGYCLVVLLPMNLFATGSALDPRSAWDGNGPEPAYVKQEWPKARVLTWAKPGVSGPLSVAANWLENGKPAEKAPDEQTDIILPAADKLYTVEASKEKVRHVDIHKNAELQGKHRNDVEIWGNCWIHEGGYVLYVAIRGDRHAFIKNEGAEFPTQQNGLKYRGPKSKGGQYNATQLSHKLQICKFGTASIEFLGTFGAGDEIMLQHGRLILNGELRWSGYTEKGALEIYDGGIFELQSGARIVPFMPENNKAIYNIDVYRNGMLQAGSPERPLTSDAFVCLGFGKNDKPGRTGLYAAEGSMIRVYSSDPKKHRLVFTSTVAVPDLHDAICNPIQSSLDKASGIQGTAFQLAGDIVLNGVHFDYVSEGGLALSKSVNPSSWTDVTYGDHNAAKPEKLIGEMTVAADTYYHQRGDGASELAMVTTAVESMKTYQKEADPFQIVSLPESTRLEASTVSKDLMVPKSVVFKKSVEVTLECKAAGARMRYTLDGTEPTKDSPLYEKPIPLAKTSKVMVKAFKSGLGFSPTYSAVYVVE